MRCNYNLILTFQVGVSLAFVIHESANPHIGKWTSPTPCLLLSCAMCILHFFLAFQFPLYLNLRWSEIVSVIIDNDNLLHYLFNNTYLLRLSIRINFNIPYHLSKSAKLHKLLWNFNSAFLFHLSTGTSSCTLWTSVIVISDLHCLLLETTNNWSSEHLFTEYIC